MTVFDLTKAAQADLKAIARHTQTQWGKIRRNRYLGEIDELFRLLAANPTMGRACDEIRSGYRKFPYGAHVVFYRQLGVDELLIVRILHANMDVDAHLSVYAQQQP